MSTDPAATPPTPPAPTDAAPPPATPGTPPPAHTDQPDWSAFRRLAIVAAIAGWLIFGITGIANYTIASSHAAEANRKAKAAQEELEKVTDAATRIPADEKFNAAARERKHAEEELHHAKSRFFLGYLTGFVYWASLPLGAMALLMIRYLAKTSWGLLLTRPFEAATRTLPLLFLLFLPLAAAVAMHDYSPYWWSNPHAAHAPEVDPDPNAAANPGDKREQTVKTGLLAMQKRITERQKEERESHSEAVYGFLSAPGYLVVGIVLFAIWGTFIYFLNKWGQEASDATDPRVVDRNLEKLSNISGPGIIIFAITTTAAASQWVMSLEPGWSSTMFPVIYTINQFLTCLTFCVALFLLLAARPPFAQHMRPKFQLDMGTLMLAFTLFWSYTSFSQYMLVWIGNLPEEIPFFLKRSNHEGHASGWWYVSAALIALHFALPFLLLLFRNIKLHPVRLRVVAVYLAIICAVDVTWWIAPSAQPHGNVPTWLMDVGAIMGVGGVWGLYFIHQLSKRPLFPDNQAFLLPEGHHHATH